MSSVYVVACDDCRWVRRLRIASGISLFDAQKLLTLHRAIVHDGTPQTGEVTIEEEEEGGE
jgi:hypothetical protein